MANAVGRLGWLGIAKEVTPGTPVTPATYLPFTEQSLGEKHEPIGDIAAKGVREQQYGSVQGKQWGEGAFTVNLDETRIGNILLMLFGTVNTSTVSGSIKDHTFSRNNSNTPQTYTITLDRVTDRKTFPYCVAKSGEIAFSDGLVTAKVDVLSQFPATSVSGTLTVASGNLYGWKDAQVLFGTTLTTADVATPTKVSEFSLTIDNASVPTFRSGVQQPVSIDHTTFRVFGSFKLYFESTTQLDAYRALTKQAMILRLTGRGLAGGYKEALNINLASVRLTEATVETPVDDLIMLSCSFEAEYDSVTSKSADAVLRNITASY